MSDDLEPLNLPSSLERIFARFPKLRPPLPEEYKEIYLQNFLAQRTGGSFILKIVTHLEEWNHQQVVREGRPGGRILEIGAGTINHLPLEKDFESYDIVEPMEEAYQGSHNLDKVRAVYPDISAVPAEEKYARIFCGRGIGACSRFTQGDCPDGPASQRRRPVSGDHPQ
jgi:hypothetical protein